MSIDKFKTGANLNQDLGHTTSEDATPYRLVNQAQDEAVVPQNEDLKRLAKDLLQTHGEKFASLFGGALFGARKAKWDDDQKRKSSEAKIQRIHLSSQDDIRSLVVECLDPLYQIEPIINALTDYLTQHYEMMNDVEWKTLS